MINGMLRNAGVEIIRKMAFRSMDACLEQREGRIRKRILYGALESQISIVRNISEKGKCLCGTSIGRTGMGRENIKALLSRLENRRDELKEMDIEPVWTSDQVLEGARRSLAVVGPDRKDYLGAIKDLKDVNWRLSSPPPKDQGDIMEELITRIRDFERTSNLLDSKKSELKDALTREKELERRIKELERELVRIWGARNGKKIYSDRMDLLDRLIEKNGSFADDVTERTRERIERRANSIINALEEGRGPGSIRIHPTTFRLGRERIIGDETRILPMAYLSAGERELMALSIISSLPGIPEGMLMLDSPFPSIDTAKKARIIERLPTIAKRVYISFPDGTLSDKEISLASKGWKGEQNGFKWYTLVKEEGGSMLKERGGDPF